ncbi:porin family protein [bacterium]|nr:porin family protein [bacterium]
MRSVLTTLLILAALGTLPDEGAAQSRSTTGRTLEPARAEEPEKAPEALDGRPSSPWSLQLTMGSVGGGDLFHARTVDDVVVPWLTVGGGSFQSSRFSTSIDRNFGLGFAVLRSVGSRTRLRFDVESASLDLAAEALLGQGGGVFRFDSLDVMSVGLGLQVALASSDVAPYAALGVALVDYSADRSRALDQTRFGLSILLGWARELGEGYGVVVEGRATRTGFDDQDFLPETRLGFDPEIEIEWQEHVTLLGIKVGIRKNI